MPRINLCSACASTLQVLAAQGPRLAVGSPNSTGRALHAVLCDFSPLRLGAMPMCLLQDPHTSSSRFRGSSSLWSLDASSLWRSPQLRVRTAFSKLHRCRVRTPLQVRAPHSRTRFCSSLLICCFSWRCSRRSSAPLRRRGSWRQWQLRPQTSLHGWWGQRRPHLAARESSHESAPFPKPTLCRHAEVLDWSPSEFASSRLLSDYQSCSLSSNSSWWHSFSSGYFVLANPVTDEGRPADLATDDGSSASPPTAAPAPAHRAHRCHTAPSRSSRDTAPAGPAASVRCSTTPWSQCSTRISRALFRALQEPVAFCSGLCLAPRASALYSCVCMHPFSLATFA
mmetsp:Transcript_76316/g.247582  ORF Transcript_76316/g.247582 Transcript_76316/m.247582 type:complete len:340 (-) Transcript_76316:566-1585(-)